LVSKEEKGKEREKRRTHHPRGPCAARRAGREELAAPRRLLLWRSSPRRPLEARRGPGGPVEARRGPGDEKLEARKLARTRSLVARLGSARLVRIFKRTELRF
jgi:hypothetical protein